MTKIDDMSIDVDSCFSQPGPEQAPSNGFSEVLPAHEDLTHRSRDPYDDRTLAGRKRDESGP
jgi:hypothetical protein